jgi:hypothetical protein
MNSGGGRARASVIKPYRAGERVREQITGQLSLLGLWLPETATAASNFVTV